MAERALARDRAHPNPLGPGPHVHGIDLMELLDADFDWKPGWELTLDDGHDPAVAGHLPLVLGPSPPLRTCLADSCRARYHALNSRPKRTGRLEWAKGHERTHLHERAGVAAPRRIDRQRGRLDALIVPERPMSRSYRPRSVRIDTLWSALTNGLRLAASLLLFWFFVRRVGIEQYGVYAGTQGVAAVLTLLLVMWSPLLHLQRVLRDGEEADHVFTSSMTGATAGAATGLGVALVVHPLLLPQVALPTYLSIIIAEMVLMAVVENVAAAVNVRADFRRASQIRWIGILAKPAAIIAVATLFTPTSLAAYAYVNLSLSLAAAAIVLYLGSSFYGLPIAVGRLTSDHVREGLPYSGIAGVSTIQEDGDKTLMVRFGHSVDAGSYAAAYRLIQVLLFPIGAVTVATHPRLLTRTANSENDTMRRIAAYATAPVLYGIAAMAGVLVFAPTVLRLVGGDLADDADILRWLAPLLLLRALTEIPANGLITFGRNRLRLRIAIGAATLNMVLNLTLIPAHSWRGAVVATLVAEIAFAAMIWGALWRCHRRQPAHGAETERSTTVASALPS